MAVIKDVAKLANVSVSTVSKFFNNPKDLSEPYRQRVEVAVKELNFTPSPLARSLRTKRANTIALVVPDITNTFYAEVYNSIRRAALAKGFMTQLYTTEENVNILNELLTQFSSAEVDGVILCFLDEDEIISHLTDATTCLPITLMSWDVDTPFNSVILNLFSTMFQATNYLISLGHTRIAYVNGIRDSRISKEKFSGFQKAMNDHGLEIPEEFIYNGNYLFRTGYQAAKQFMQTPRAPTAILAANDILAIGCCKYLRLNGFCIPDDVAVVGMDGIQLSKIYDPTITTMATPIDEMCAGAVSLLINKVLHPSSKNRQSVFKSELIEGRSTNSSAPLYLDF